MTKTKGCGTGGGGATREERRDAVSVLLDGEKGRELLTWERIRCVGGDDVFMK